MYACVYIYIHTYVHTGWAKKVSMIIIAISVT